MSEGSSESFSTELRIFVPIGATARLQYRTKEAMFGHYDGAGYSHWKQWSEWRDVPTVVEGDA